MYLGEERRERVYFLFTYTRVYIIISKNHTPFYLIIKNVVMYYYSCISVLT